MPGFQEPTEDTMTDVDPMAPSGSTGGESPKEDDATKATREELKHTMISEKLVGGFPIAHSQSAEQRRREATPETTGLRARQADALRDQVGSPKKKRAHDEVSGDDDSRQQLSQGKAGEPAKEAGPAADASSVAGGPTDTLNGGSGSGEGGRSDRAEPEKKRLRDREAEEAAKTDKDVKAAPPETKAGTTAAPKDTSAVPVATSSSAFAASGFSKLTSSTSPFGSLGTTATSGKPSLFGSASPAASSFGSLSGSAAQPAASSTPKFSFGNAATSASPFASVSGTSTGKLFPFSSTGAGGFGAASTSGKSSGGFGSTISGPRLTSFAKPGEVFKSDKPSKPFGAPESDAEENVGGESGPGADEEENADEADADEAGGSEAKDFEERVKALGGEEKKKPKLQKVEINDGEKGEATIIQVRARMYYLDKDQGGWKERGAGMLKLNVPQACVQYDESGNVIPASFDASMLAPGSSDKDESEDEDDKDEDKSDSSDANSEAGSSEARSATKKAAAPARTVVRLIMRQDSTHRVILNTVVLAATEFQERQTLKSTTILFTAFEGEDAKPVNVQMKASLMNAANAKTFLATVGGVQKELRDI